MVRALKPVFDADLTRNQVDQCTWNKEGGYATRAFFLDQQGCFRNRLQTTDPRTNHHTRAQATLFILGCPARITHRHFGRCDTIKDEIIHLAAFFGFHPIIGIKGAVRSIPIGDFAGVFCRHVRCIKMRDRTCT